MRVNQRFARVFEFDPAYAGTPEQREAVVETLTYQHRHFTDDINLRLAQLYKASGRGAIKVGFRDLSANNWLGHAGFHFLSLHYQLHPNFLGPIALHEYGHVLDENEVIDNAGRATFAALTGGQFHKETHADAVRDLIMSDGSVWPALLPLLIPKSWSRPL